MADCLKADKADGFVNMDGVEGPRSSSVTVAKGGGGGSGGLRACAIVYMVLITFVSVCALILACWSTSEVRILRSADALLVSDPRKVPSGYDVFSLGTGLGYWSRANDMLHGRSDMGVVAYDKYVFLIGGMSAQAGVNGTVPTVLDSVVRYDTQTGLMEEVEPLLRKSQRFGYALVKDTIYVLGGSDLPGNDAGATDLVQVYNITTNKWAYAGKLKVPRIDACAASVDGKVYVLGGYDSPDFHSLASVEEYPATGALNVDSWTLLPGTSNLTVSRGDCRAAAVDGKLYAVGGVEWYENPIGCAGDLWFRCYRFLKSVEAFDPTTRKWTTKAPMLSARGDFGIDVLPGNRIIVAGGEATNGEHNEIAMYNVEEYIVDDNLWIEKAPLPEARFRADLGYVNGRTYVFGGSPTCALTNDSCVTIALKTVYAMADVPHPKMYAFYKHVDENTAVNTRSLRRMLL